MNAISRALRPAIENDVDGFTRILLEQGYVIIPDLADPALLERLYRDLDVHFASAEFCTGPFYGETTKRFGRLLIRSEATQHFVLHPLTYAIVEQVLGRWCETLQLNLTQAIEIHPGAPAQFPHRDQDMWRADKGIQEYMINVMWALDDFTEENGATRIWPGSHLMAPDSMLPEEDAIKAVMPRGSAAIFLGSTQHAGGANLSTRPRRGMIISYCQAWLKPWENQWLSYPPEIARRFTSEIAGLVGYRQLAPTLGNFEGQCPSVLLGNERPDLLSFTDLLTPEQQQMVRDWQASLVTREGPADGASQSLGCKTV